VDWWINCQSTLKLKNAGMKLIYLLSGILICCCSFSNCDKDENFTCVEFKDEVTTLDPDPVHATNYVNVLLSPLFPYPTLEDPLGHEANLSLFAEKLEQHCDVEVLIECYTCIETFPVQSHVMVTLDSAGVMISRTLDIRTPPDTIMTLQHIHR
jgi:hypothetical protein